jgi:hypothetical protein
LGSRAKKIRIRVPTLGNYLLTILTGYGGGRVACLTTDEHLLTRPMFLHEVGKYLNIGYL